MIPLLRAPLALVAVLALTACREEAATAPPAPVSMTAESTGHYCQMDVLGHDGPKAQIHVKGLPDPLWFGQVRDAVAFLRLPEETAEVTAIYVSDMGAAANWGAPGADNWIDARTAVYVIGGALTGGMGAPEATPFATREAAETWRAAHGGVLTALDDIPDAYVLAPVDVASLNSAKETR